MGSHCHAICTMEQRIDFHHYIKFHLGCCILYRAPSDSFCAFAPPPRRMRASCFSMKFLCSRVGKVKWPSSKRRSFRHDEAGIRLARSTLVNSAIYVAAWWIKHIQKTLSLNCFLSLIASSSFRAFVISKCILQNTTYQEIILQQLDTRCLCKSTAARLREIERPR